jgi:hypothetical protein
MRDKPITGIVSHRMSRDIVTTRDAALANVGQVAPSRGGGLGIAMGESRHNVVEPDSWYKRLMKYIPGEAVGLYVTLDRIAAAQTAADSTAISSSIANKPTYDWVQIGWLTAALLVAVVFNIIYLLRIWKLQRRVQIVVSTVALVAYVYSTGGVFAALGVAPPKVQAFVLIATAALLTLFEPPGQLRPVATPSDLASQPTSR